MVNSDERGIALDTHSFEGYPSHDSFLHTPDCGWNNESQLSSVGWKQLLVCELRDGGKRIRDTGLCGLVCGSPWL